MRYPTEHKEQAKQNLLAASGSFAKEHGFFNSGVDALATAAGVTSGALYKHFDGKAGLFEALVEAEVQQSLQRFADATPGNAEHMKKIVAAYLSMAHVANPSAGCMLPTMSAEVGRADDAAKQHFQQGALQIKDILSQWTGEDQAWPLLAQCVGAVMLARAMSDEKCQREILRTVRRSADQLIEHQAVL